MVRAQVRIPLRHRKILVTKKLLHRPQIHAPHDQMGRKGMTQGMEGYVPQFGSRARCCESRSDISEALPEPGENEPTRISCQGADLIPFLEGGSQGRVEGDFPDLSALGPGEVEHTVSQVNIVPSESKDLRMSPACMTGAGNNGLEATGCLI